MKLKMVTALVMGAALSACSSSALMVEKAPTTQYRVATANLVYDAATIPVEDGTQQYLQTKMKEAFLTDKNAVFTEGSELTVRYHFVGHNEGSRVGRWLTGGLAGGSKTYIEANFMDQAGTQVGSVRSEGSVGLGIAGGSAKSGIDGAVKKIAQYAAVTFKK
jgi:hypothetical protein